jgi:hypothetical protein
MLNVWKIDFQWIFVWNMLNLWKYNLLWKVDVQWIFVWNMLNVWKYHHLCEKLTFIGYLYEISSMWENMTIYVKIWLSLDIYVKYARCVKICPFDVLVLFLMPSMQFLKPYVQFLMDTILNLIIIQFLMKKKGDVCYDGACPISIKGRRVLWERVSQLPNCTKMLLTEYSP